MIEVPQLWLPDRLRERREDERLLPPGRTRRWMPGYPCCPKGCLLFEDDFDREAIGDEWTVVSGDWSIDSGRLTSSDANAKICIEAGSQRIASMQDAIVVESVIPYVANSRPRIYTSGSDYVEFLNASGRVYAYINGSTSGVTSVSVGATATIRVCHTSRGIIATVGGVTSASGTSNAEPSIPCLGFGSDAGSGNSGFNDVSVQHGVTIDGACPHCAACSICPDAPPGAVEVTLSGITLADGVSDCLVPSLENFANDTFILYPVSPCRYRFGCLVPTSCRDGDDPDRTEVNFSIDFWFQSLRTYRLMPFSMWQTGGNYNCNEDTGRRDVTSDLCSGMAGGYDQLAADNWTCRPDNYEFETINAACAIELLNYDNATFVVTSL